MNKMYTSAITMYLILTVLLSDTKVNAQDMSEHIVTAREGWHICSPAFYANAQQKRQQTGQQTFTAQLAHMGEKADQAWAYCGDKKELLEALRDIFSSVDEHFMINVIDEILSDEALLARIMRASYKNATGFLKVVLVEGKEYSWKLRLHVWQEKEEKEFPHNHKWDFYSKIVSGYLRQDIYAPTKDEQDPGAQIYQVREPISLMPARDDGTPACPCRDTYTLQTKGDAYPTVLLHIASRNIIGRGESYLMPNHLMHRIVPGRGAISFVFTSRTKNENSEVFIPVDRASSQLICNAPSVTMEELREELVRVRSFLQQLQIRPQYLPEMVDLQHRWFDPKDTDLFVTDDWRSIVAREHAMLKPVMQFSKTEKRQFMLSANNIGNIMVGGKAINVDQEYLFVLVDNVMFAAPKDFHHEAAELICHTSFSDYGPVDAAGVLRFNNDGTLCVIEAYSGHYAPNIEHMYIAGNYLRSLGVCTDNVVCTTYQDRKV